MTGFHRVFMIHHQRVLTNQQPASPSMPSELLSKQNLDASHMIKIWTLIAKKTSVLNAKFRGTFPLIGRRMKERQQ
jgi:hypothetical protein